MATTKITITLNNDQLDEIRALVTSNKATSVSAFVKHAVGVALSDAAGWKEMLDEALQQLAARQPKRSELGPMPFSSRPPKKASRKRKAA